MRPCERGPSPSAASRPSRVLQTEGLSVCPRGSCPAPSNALLFRTQVHASPASHPRSSPPPPRLHDPQPGPRRGARPRHSSVGGDPAPPQSTLKTLGERGAGSRQESAPWWGPPGGGRSESVPGGVNGGFGGRSKAPWAGARTWPKAPGVKQGAGHQRQNVSLAMTVLCWGGHPNEPGGTGNPEGKRL